MDCDIVKLSPTAPWSITVCINGQTEYGDMFLVEYDMQTL